MIDSIAATTSTISRLYHIAVLQQWAIALYRLPGEKEPICMIQTNGSPLHLADPLDALKMKGFVMAPWVGDTNTPALLILPDYTLYGWNPDIEAVIQHTSTPKTESNVELPIPTAIDIPFDTYNEQLKSIQAAIGMKTVEKAILSRVVSQELLDGFNAAEALQLACQQYPNAFCYLVSVPGMGQWMGASPEVLINVHGQQIQTVALAGTKSNNPLSTNELSWLSKELHEHELVRTHILKLLQQYCQQVTVDGPNTIQAGNLFHLRSDFAAQLPEDGGTDALRQLLQAMHPTPAISGSPKSAAIRLIGEVEPHQRAYYAGFLGTVMGEGDTQLFVNLRCMRILPHKALLYVGGGITTGSVAMEEWQETKAKADTLLNILK